MNKKDKIITINEKSESNTYRCDVSKSFIVLKQDNSFRRFLSEFFFVMFGGIFGALSIAGVIMLIWSVIINDITRIIISAIVAFVFVVACVPFFCFEVRKRNKYKKNLAEANVWLGIFVDTRVIKDEKRRTRYWTIKNVGNDETKEIEFHSLHIELNQKIAIATIGDKEVILTKCTLIAS